MLYTTGFRRIIPFSGLPFEGYEAPAEPDRDDVWWDQVQPMAPQLRNWTCAACALDWVVRSTALVPDYDRERAVYDIGYPEQINSSEGLTNINGPGQALIDVLSYYGQESEQGWLDYDTIFAKAQRNPAMLAGVRWYHWVALRGTSGGNLWIANSAPGYKGMWDILGRYDFDRLGPFNTVFLK